MPEFQTLEEARAFAEANDHCSFVFQGLNGTFECAKAGHHFTIKRIDHPERMVVVYGEAARIVA